MNSGHIPFLKKFKNYLNIIQNLHLVKNVKIIDSKLIKIPPPGKIRFLEAKLSFSPPDIQSIFLQFLFFYHFLSIEIKKLENLPGGIFWRGLSFFGHF